MKHVISKTGQGSLRRTKNISVRYTGPLPPPKFLRTNREWKWSQNRRAYDTPLALHLSCPDLCLYERTVDRAIVHHFAIRSNIKIFCNPNCVPRILIRKDLNFKKARSSLIVRFWSVEKKRKNDFDHGSRDFQEIRFTISAVGRIFFAWSVMRFSLFAYVCAKHECFLRRDECIVICDSFKKL